MGEVIALRPTVPEELWAREERLTRKIQTALLLGDYAAVRRIAKLAEHYDEIIYDEPAIYSENLISPYD